MNPIAHIDHPRQAIRPNIAAGEWDDFAPAPRRERHSPAAASITRTKARARHAHLSWSETPDLFLREEMS